MNQVTGTQGARSGGRALCRRREVNGVYLSSYAAPPVNEPVHFPSPGIQGENVFPCFGQVMDVEADHNCCFRSMALALTGTQERWREVKTEVINSIEEYFEDAKAHLVYAHRLFFETFAEYRDWIMVDKRWGSVVELVSFAKHWGYSMVILNTNFTIKLTHALFDKTRDLVCFRFQNADHFQVMQLCKNPDPSSL